MLEEALGAGALRARPLSGDCRVRGPEGNVCTGHWAALVWLGRVWWGQGQGKGKEARGLCRSLKQPVSFNGTQGGSCGFNSSLGFATGMSLSMQKPP